MNGHKRWIGIALSIPLLMVLTLALVQVGFSPQTARAQTGSGITAPEPNAVVSGEVTVMGTATDANFQRYELYFKPAEAPESAYAFFASGEAEVIGGPLGLWDTSDLEPGLYTLRMRVVRIDGNYTEYFVREIQVAEQETEAAQEPTATLTETATITPTAEITAEATAEVVETVTPTPEAAAEETPAATDEEDEEDLAAGPQILADRAINVRGGPGTTYPVLGATTEGERYAVVGVTQDGGWWQIEFDGTTGWVLSTLVTAENVEDVPVITDLPPTPTPAAEATATPVPTATPTAAAAETTDSVVVEEAVAVAAPIRAGATGPVTITLVGADDADAVQIFLRSMLAAYAPNTNALTATVGALPDDLPLDLTIPATATVVGGVMRSGEMAGGQVFLATDELATDEEGEGLLDLVREQLLASGFTTPPSEALGGPNQVFLPSEMAMPALLCNTDDQLIANLSVLSIANAADVVNVSINAYDRFGSPCEVQDQPVDTTYAMLPQLDPPADATVRPSGGSRGGTFVSAEATIITAMTATELAETYEAQLEEAGWVQLDQNALDAVAWSAWSFTDDEGDEWSGTFYVVRQAGDIETYLATLRAERQ